MFVFSVQYFVQNSYLIFEITLLYSYNNLIWYTFQVYQVNAFHTKLHKYFIIFFCRFNMTFDAWNPKCVFPLFPYYFFHFVSSCRKREIILSFLVLYVNFRAADKNFWWCDRDTICKNVYYQSSILWKNQILITLFYTYYYWIWYTLQVFQINAFYTKLD